MLQSDHANGADSADRVDWATIMGPYLAMIAGAHAARKRRAIITAMDAVIEGHGLRWVWEQPGTCSKNAWYKWRRSDVVFEQVLTLGLALAREQGEAARQEGERLALTALQQARQRIALESPQSVAVIVSLRDSADQEPVRLRAAQDLLDRALGQAALPVTGADGEALLPMPALVAALRAARGKMEQEGQSAGDSAE